MRPSGRHLEEMRPVSIETGVMRHAEGSCLIKVGKTHVLCSASIDERDVFGAQQQSVIENLNIPIYAAALAKASSF